ncbi:hypothetical protein BGX28_000259, partial [Mortierella sp. GBA30]
MVRINLLSYLAVVFVSVHAALADPVPSGTYKIVKGIQHITDIKGKQGQPVFVQPPYKPISNGQKWEIVDNGDGTVMIKNKQSSLYLSISQPVSSPWAGLKPITVENDAQKWELVYSANQEAHFIQYPETSLVIDIASEKSLKSFPPRLALSIRNAYEDNQVWKLVRE